MATCTCCKKNTGFLGGNSWRADIVFCDNCNRQIGPILIPLEQSQEPKSVAESYVRAIAKAQEMKMPQNVLDEITSLYSERKKSLDEKAQADKATILEEEQRIEKERIIQQQIQTIMFTTGFDFEGYTIKKYLAVLSASTVQGTGFLSEFSADIADLFGEESNLFSQKLETARESAMTKLRYKAYAKGANAVIGVDFDYITLRNNMLGVICNGTAVYIEEII